jgi:hypothetical protein
VELREFFYQFFPVATEDQLREELFLLTYSTQGGFSAEWVERQTRRDIDWHKKRLSEQWDEEKAAVERARKKRS